MTSKSTQERHDRDRERNETLPEGTVPEKHQIAGLVARIRPSGRRRGPLLLAVVATLGSFLFGYDTGVIAGALPFMHLPDAAGGLGLTTAEEGAVTSLLAFGAAVGALVGGKFNDRIGRKRSILLLAAVFIVGTVGCTLSPSVLVIAPFRFILGLAVGGASSAVPLYLSETAPKRVRGPMVAVDQFMIVFGQLIAYCMNAVISKMQGGPQVVVETDPSGRYGSGDTVPWDAVRDIQGIIVSDGNGHAWRWMLVLATVPAILLWIGMRRLPESPRWHAARQQYYDVIATLHVVRRPDKDDMVSEVEEMIELEQQEQHREDWSLRRGFSLRWTRRLILIGICLGLCDQLTGINTAMWYLPTVLDAAGFSTADAITLNVVTGLGSAVGSAVGFILVYRFMRRHVGMLQEFGVALALFTLAGLFHFGIEPHMNADGTIGDGIPALIPWLVLVVMSLFVFVKQAGTVTWILLAEIFPAKIRGAAQGISVGALWTCNGLVALIFPVMMDGLGGAKTYLVFAVINLGAFLFYWKVVPETKDLSLEEFEENYRKTYGD